MASEKKVCRHGRDPKWCCKCTYGEDDVWYKDKDSITMSLVEYFALPTFPRLAEARSFQYVKGNQI
jgi:hypothetical protein